MRIRWKKACAAIGLFVGISLASGGVAQTATFPASPVKLVVPFAAGGSGDIVARLFADKLSGILGQTAVVLNRPGANSVIGTEFVVRSKPDGYTFLQLSPGNVIVQFLQDNVPYDWERDLTPIIGVGAQPLALAVSSKSNIRSLPDLVATAKAMSGGIVYGSGGVGSMSHLAPALLAQKLNLQATHVPYSGLSGSVQSLLGGQTQYIFATTSDLLELAKSGTVRLLGVTSERRLADLPNVPTMIELGYPDFNPVVWTTYAAPAGTPKEVIDILSRAFRKATEDADLRAKLAAHGFEVRIRTAEETGKFMHDEAARWRKVIDDNHIKAGN
jgi:tripartite-type tricarboxylate transporter receptor subunit TctC